MRIRSTGLALLAGLSIFVAACTGSGASTAPSSVASTAASTAPSTGGSAAPSTAGSTAPKSTLKIGVVTDVGTVNDKNFNEFTFVGAQQGAAAIGADPPPVVVPTSASDYAPLIQAFVDQKFDVIVAAGFNLQNATAAAAKANPNIWFIGVDHAPCINAKGDVDPSFADCSGNIATLLPKYIAINYQEDQAGYLAGIVAGLATKSNIIGAIGGVSLCGPCVRYMQGYVLGAHSVNPAVKVKTAFVSASDFKLGFANQGAGKTFGDQFIKQNTGIDVLFQVAGLTGNGVIDAACAAKINAVGVDVDEHQSYPASQACIITSAEKHLAVSVADSIKGIADGSAKGGIALFNAANDGIGVSPFYDAASKLPADIQTKIDAAIAGMKAGTIVTCPPKPDCGKTPAPKVGD
ncbi:MAG: basic rane protein [Chloroflexota bacterium]|jgi:basic membrane protein A|nr:basic rane protein [Chloroflexota bacterium]